MISINVKLLSAIKKVRRCELKSVCLGHVQILRHVAKQCDLYCVTKKPLKLENEKAIWSIQIESHSRRNKEASWEMHVAAVSMSLVV